MKTLSPSFLLPAALLVSCASDVDVGNYPISDVPSQAEADKLDMLFVVDDSFSVSDNLSSMADHMEDLLSQLAILPGGIPSLHIGVVSTNMGVGASNEFIDGCDAGSGLSGALLQGRSGCNLVSESFLSNKIAADGSRVVNYEGPLAEAFSCMTALGDSGCGFEQPLKAMRVALTAAGPANECELAGGACIDGGSSCLSPDGIEDGNSSCGGTDEQPKSCCFPEQSDSIENRGFLRNDAHLAVIIVTDEDDCSAFDDSLFDYNDDSLGDFDSYRCTKAGLRCDDMELSDSPGDYVNCTPLDSSPYLFHPHEFVDYLTDLKGNPDDVIVSVIAGHLTSGMSVSDGAVDDICASASETAIPAYRLGYFAQEFFYHTFTSICSGDLSVAMSASGSLIRMALKDEHVPDDSMEESNAGCSISNASSSGALVLCFVMLALLRRRRTQSLCKGRGLHGDKPVRAFPEVVRDAIRRHSKRQGSPSGL